MAVDTFLKGNAYALRTACGAIWSDIWQVIEEFKQNGLSIDVRKVKAQTDDDQLGPLHKLEPTLPAQPTWVNLGPTWGQLGANLWPTCGQVLPDRGQLGPKMDPRWDHLGGSWVKLDQVTPKLGQLGSKMPSEAKLS